MVRAPCSTDVRLAADVAATLLTRLHTRASSQDGPARDDLGPQAHEEEHAGASDPGLHVPAAAGECRRRACVHMHVAAFWSDAVCHRHSLAAPVAACARGRSASLALRGTVLVLVAAAVVRVAAVRVRECTGRHVPARELDSAQRPEARQHSGGEATHRVPRWHRQE